MAATVTHVASAVVVEEEKSQSLQEELSLPILLADRVIKSAQEAESSKQECAELRKQVERLSQMLRSCVRLATSSQPLYERPIRRVAADVAKNLDRSLTLVRRCKHAGVLRHVFSITTNADFKKVFSLLESSIGDMRWLLTIFDSDEVNLSLPPIASNDPILAWVWSFISTIQMGQIKSRVDAANELASLARDNNRNRKIIVEEGGILPLLKLLKEAASPDAQTAAANALFNIATDQETVRFIVDVLGVPIIVSVLGEAPVKVQVAVANLVARMAELDSIAQEEFVRENVTRSLISLLCMDIALDLPKPESAKTTIHSLVQMKKEMTEKSTNVTNNSDGSSRGGHGQHYNKKDRELETPEVKAKVRIACAEALWKLSKGCLLSLWSAESNAELRRSAFKTNSPAAKAVLDQLLRLIHEESDAMLQTPAIRSIGCLAKTFPAKEKRMIGPLVALLSNRNVDVATEAVIALSKFVSPDNFNRSEHSKAIIEFDGVPPLMRLLKISDRAQVHGLVFLCYLALSAGNSKALEQARALNALEGAARTVLPQHPELRDLFAQAIYHLTLYQAGSHPHRQTYAP
ncbi:hypothetical protein CISIN_1g041643mg [Citrus sinensis]|uniref:DUF7792 domain-containing protein n=1 Tax=Citrus sinensis TaxID=2711 RepID=A0A067FQ66_CITSI|nr:hypothetical protein CISIN_1g041643mg [Citrus sinensis]